MASAFLRPKKKARPPVGFPVARGGISLRLLKMVRALLLVCGELVASMHLLVCLIGPGVPTQCPSVSAWLQLPESHSSIRTVEVEHTSHF